MFKLSIECDENRVPSVMEYFANAFRRDQVTVNAGPVKVAEMEKALQQLTGPPAASGKTDYAKAFPNDDRASAVAHLTEIALQNPRRRIGSVVKELTSGIEVFGTTKVFGNSTKSKKITKGKNTKGKKGKKVWS